MKIQNLKAPQGDVIEPVLPSAVLATDQPSSPSSPTPSDRHGLEIAVMKARIQHLELVIEMARSLLGSNQERLLRRLHDVPRELAVLGSKLQNLDPNAVW